jgi:hypothetical protein
LLFVVIERPVADIDPRERRAKKDQRFHLIRGNGVEKPGVAPGDVLEAKLPVVPWAQEFLL